MDSEVGPLEKALALVRAFKASGMPFALGGAIALSYWAEPRATLDIDVNVFVPEGDAGGVLDVVARLGGAVDLHRDETTVARTGQVRIEWDGTPLDLFFAYDVFHEECRTRSRPVDFLGESVQVLSAEDLAVFKVIFNRPKDWLDIEAMLTEQGSAFDVEHTREWLTRVLGEDDSRVDRFEKLVARQWT